MKKMLFAAFAALALLLTACGSKNAAATSNSTQAAAAASTESETELLGLDDEGPLDIPEDEREPEFAEEEQTEPEDANESEQSAAPSANTSASVDTEAFWNSDHTEFDLEGFIRSYHPDNFSISPQKNSLYVVWKTTGVKLHITIGEKWNSSHVIAVYHDKLYEIWSGSDTELIPVSGADGNCILEEDLNVIIAALPRLLAGVDECPFSGLGVEHDSYNGPEKSSGYHYRHDD